MSEVHWYLTRFAYLPQGTLGRLDRPEGAQSLYTIERPWRSNQAFVSCIPEGSYAIAYFSGLRWKDALEICSVPGRSFILFHPANIADDVQGCLGPGLSWRVNEAGEPSVRDSRKAFNVLMEDYRARQDHRNALPDITLHVQSARAPLAV